jgi:hypothetical protein
MHPLTATLTTLPTIEVTEPGTLEMPPGILERYTTSLTVKEEVLIGEYSPVITTLPTAPLGILELAMPKTVAVTIEEAEANAIVGI